MKKLSAIVLCTMFASMQIASATIDTGLNNAVINTADGGFAGIQTGPNTATLNFNGNSHVNWNTLNVGQGETLNFNAIGGASGITVLNTVNSGMTQVYGSINANDGISRLIISNPNGMIYDGAHFTTAGDLMLTTQALGANYVNGNMQVVGLNQEATQGISIKNSDFTVGGEFNLIAPSVEVVKGAVKAENGFKLVTQDGQNFLVCPTTSNDTQHKAVRMETVNIDGDVYIVSGKDIIAMTSGGEIKGNLNIVSDGNVGINYSDNGKTLHVTGDANVASDGRVSYFRNAKVDGNLNTSNSGGFLEVGNLNVAGDVNLKTTVETNAPVKHFVHIIGDNEIGGNLNVDSIHNVHIGAYDLGTSTFLDGHVNVAGNANILAREGSIATTVDMTADKINMESGTLNILTDGNAVLKANEYSFKANRYIGGINDSEHLIDIMENYIPIPNVAYQANVEIAGGNVNKIETADNGYAFIRSHGDMNVNGVNANNVKLSADQADIVIGDNVHANTIVVGGETKNLTVALPSRDYRLKYTDIKDTEVITINPTTEITYDMANGENGWNKGTQTADNTYLVVPGPQPPIPTPPPTPDPNDNVKLLHNPTPAPVDTPEVLTPIAFAADLEDEEEMPIRKNVDGSVTVVRPFTPKN